MIKRIFKPSTVGAATALVALTSFVSYAIGLLRDRTISTKFGTSAITDTYNASFLIPDMLFNLFIAGALSAAFMPVFADFLKKDKEEAFKIAHSMLTAATLMISILAAIAFVLMPQIVPIMFHEADPTMQSDIINMTRIMLGSSILFAISNTLGNILMSFKHFMSYSLSPILYNLGIIIGVITLHEKIGIYSAAVGVLIGTTLHAGVRIIDSFSTEYRYRPSLALNHPGFKKILRLMIPKSIGLIAWQINLLIYAKVGIMTAIGSFAAFNFARNIQSIPVSLFGIAFATAVFPFLSDSVSNNDKEAYTEQIRKTIQRILFFTIPAAAGMMIMSTQIVELILSGGAFDAESIRMTATILSFFALSVPFESLVHILARAYYARQNTLIPMLINVFSMTLIALTTIYIAPKYGIQWFSIGFTGGYAIYVLLISILLRKHLKNFQITPFIKSLAKTLAATAIMLAAIHYMVYIENWMPLKLAHSIRIIVGGGLFFLAAAALKSPEISSVSYIFSRIFKKNTNAQEESIH